MILYNCLTFPPHEIYNFFWILSRDQFFATNQQEQYEILLNNAVARTYYDVNNTLVTNQDNCPCI